MLHESRFFGSPDSGAIESVRSCRRLSQCKSCVVDTAFTFFFESSCTAKGFSDFLPFFTSVTRIV